ncbi:Protein of unknown function [Pyronema omphalodes CBS 100304]|uniref:Uncharacterized protein n=1 Tax=Pyronema omphalodes (strain CBS 100304) TaxID=1076935 RepID=U4LJ93_PYROM|nr:Protein of unknown function [Pyronema omphalodes CBS 100304]
MAQLRPQRAQHRSHSLLLAKAEDQDGPNHQKHAKSTPIFGTLTPAPLAISNLQTNLARLPQEYPKSPYAPSPYTHFALKQIVLHIPLFPPPPQPAFSPHRPTIDSVPFNPCRTDLRHPYWPAASFLINQLPYPASKVLSGLPRLPADTHSLIPLSTTPLHPTLLNYLVLLHHHHPPPTSRNASHRDENNRCRQTRKQHSWTQQLSDNTTPWRNYNAVLRSWLPTRALGRSRHN